MPKLIAKFADGYEKAMEAVRAKFHNVKVENTLVVYDKIKKLGNVFQDRKGLKSITLPEGLCTIEDSAFSGCSSLTSITIPESVKSIASDAFYGCIYEA